MIKKINANRFDVVRKNKKGDNFQSSSKEIPSWNQQKYLEYKDLVQLAGAVEYTISACHEIAKGFRFMPLSLVRLSTFRLSTWVGWV